MKARSLHRRLAPAIVVPLLFTVVSGMAFRVGRSWFGLSADFGGWMMALHEGRYLGERLVPFYVLGVGLALLAMIASSGGLKMTASTVEMVITLFMEKMAMIPSWVAQDSTL